MIELYQIGLLFSFVFSPLWWIIGDKLYPAHSCFSLVFSLSSCHLALFLFRLVDSDKDDLRVQFFLMLFWVLPSFLIFPSPLVPSCLRWVVLRCV